MELQSRLCILIASVSMLVASCSKEVSLPEKSSETKTVVFSTELAKTTLDGDAVRWEEGDIVKIVWTESGAVKSTDATVNAQTGEITATVGTADKYYYAVYPSTAPVVIASSAQDYMTVTTSSVTDGSWRKANYAVARSLVVDNTGKLVFNNVTGAVKFTVSTDAVTKVVFDLPEGSVASAAVKLQFGADDLLTGSPVLSSKISSMEATVDGPGTYYLPVVWGAEWNKGFDFAEYAGEDVAVFGNTGTSVSWNRNMVKVLGTLEEHGTAPFDMFVKPEACGDRSGKDWDNACDAAKTVSVLCGETKSKFIYGRNIYLAAGKYDFCDATAADNNLKISSAVKCRIFGGYPANASGKSLEGRDITKNETIIVNAANGKTSTARIFTFKSCKADIDFDGISFTPCSGTAANGGAFFVDTDCTGTLDFHACTFKDANTTAYGSAAMFTSMNIGMTDCTVKNNLSTSTDAVAGGAILVSNKATASFDGCTFKWNTGKTNGVGLCAAAGSVVNVKGCVFAENLFNRAAATLETAGNARGGALSVYYSSSTFNGVANLAAPVVHIDSCQFTNNTTDNAAGADISIYSSVAGKNPEILINRSYFRTARSNAASTYVKKYFSGKSINVDGYNSNTFSVVGIYNCTFSPTSSAYANLPTIGWIDCKMTIVNCTLVDKGVAIFRNDMRSTSVDGPYLQCNLFNNCAHQIANDSNNNSINCHLSTKQENLNAGYNLMGPTKNAYTMGAKWSGTKWTAGSPKPFAATDGYVLYEDMWYRLMEGGYYEFNIAPGAEADADRPVQYATAAQVESFVQSKCPKLDSWLKTIHSSPYLLDIRGESRNPNKVQHGSWDPYLAE